MRSSSEQELDLAERLRRVQASKTMRLTTRGRKTDKRHTVPVWFTVDFLTVACPVIRLATLNPDRDWVRNAKKKPVVEVEIAGERFEGNFSLEMDRAAIEATRRLLAKKYWISRVAGWLGFSSRESYVIRDLH